MKTPHCNETSLWPAVADVAIVIPMRAAVTLIALLAFAPGVEATSSYEYKPDEYAPIEAAKSPDHHYSLVAHGEDELGQTHFEIYLIDTRSGTRVPLGVIHPFLDTAPAAYAATWSSDSRHFSLRWRSDRHVMTIAWFRITDGCPHELRRKDN